MSDRGVVFDSDPAEHWSNRSTMAFVNPFDGVLTRRPLLAL